MKRHRRWILPLVVGLVLYVVFPSKVRAYLDPGTGSYVWQMLLAALVGGLFALKMYWQRIKAALANLFSKDEEDEQVRD